MRLTKKDLETVKAFAHKRLMSRNYYTKLGNFKYSDIIVGGLAEIAAHRWLNKVHGIETTEPDFGIYDTSKKSFDADLVEPFDGPPYEKYYHIKGQSVLQKGKPWQKSWLFQKNDPIVQQNCDNNHYLIFCIVDIDTLEVEIFGMMSLNFIHRNGLFKKPKKIALQETKSVIRHIIDFITSYN